MNAPDKLPIIPIAPGIYVLRPAAAKTDALRRQMAGAILAALRRAKHLRGGRAGSSFLKNTRDSRYAR